MTEKLYYIDIGYACFGIETKNGIVVNTAPISKNSLNKPIDCVLNFYKFKRNAKIQVLENEGWVKV